VDETRVALRELPEARSSRRVDDGAQLVASLADLRRQQRRPLLGLDALDGVHLPVETSVGDVLSAVAALTAGDGLQGGPAVWTVERPRPFWAARTSLARSDQGQAFAQVHALGLAATRLGEVGFDLDGHPDMVFTRLQCQVANTAYQHPA